LHPIIQKWFDKKDGHTAVRSGIASTSPASDAPPLIYAFLPLLPITLIFIFSPIFGSKIKMSVITSMLIGVFAGMVLEYIRSRDWAKVAGSIQSFFDGMGTAFATIVSLIIAAETFAAGLKAIGAVDAIIHSAESGFGGYVMVFIMQSITAAAAIVTGSGDAEIFSFAPLAPEVARQIGIAPVHILIPVQFAATIARSISPVSAVCIAVAGLAEVPTVDISKRTAIPMIGAFIAMTIANFIAI